MGMLRWLAKSNPSPIGVDIGAHAVKLAQLSADKSRLLAVSRWDLSGEGMTAADEVARMTSLVEGLRSARETQRFRGNDAVLCLSHRELFLQNLRAPKTEGLDLDRFAKQEAAGRLPFPLDEAELRCLETGEIRQGEATLRELVLLACHKPRLEELLTALESAGLRPRAVDVEPLALLRGYLRQFRREDDLKQRVLFVHVGHSCTAVLIARGDEVTLMKYLDLGGRQLDEAVSRNLRMPLAEAAALRRHNGDRRADMQDPEVARGLADATRPVWERLCSELSLCARYHNVAFRGQPLSRMLLGGGEATPALGDLLASRLGLKCQLTDHARGHENFRSPGRPGQWDVAIGLALRAAE